MSIPFTQFMMPDGRQVPVSIQMPVATEEKAKVLLNAGFRFEIEMLSTGEISMEVVDHEDEPIAAEICRNGPQVLTAIAKMVEDAFDEKDAR